MKEITLDAEVREANGKGPARQNRMSGNIPAVVYGPEIEPKSISIDSRKFSAAMRAVAGTNAIFNLELGGNARKVIVRDMQLDPVSSKILHVDFHAVSLTKPIHISVPIHFQGIPVGVKVDAGIMQTNMRAVNISCLVSDIPDFIPLDVSALNVGDTVHVSDLSIPNATILDEESRTVVVVAAPTVVKEIGTAEGEEGAEAAEGAAAPDSEGEATEG